MKKKFSSQIFYPKFEYLYKKNLQNVKKEYVHFIYFETLLKSLKRSWVPKPILFWTPSKTLHPSLSHSYYHIALVDQNMIIRSPENQNILYDLLHVWTGWLQCLPLNLYLSKDANDVGVWKANDGYIFMICPHQRRVVEHDRGQKQLSCFLGQTNTFLHGKFVSKPQLFFRSNIHKNLKENVKGKSSTCVIMMVSNSMDADICFYSSPEPEIRFSSETTYCQHQQCRLQSIANVYLHNLMFDKKTK